MGYKSVDLIRSAWKRFVLIVQPLQFHYSLDDRRIVIESALREPTKRHSEPGQ